MNNLQRMIVIPPEIFEKFKHLVLGDEQLTDLDKMMKSILYNKKLNDLNKWHLYRQNLIKYSSVKRKNAHESKFKWPAVKHVEGVGVQTISTKDQPNSPTASQTDEIPDVAIDEVFEDAEEEMSQSENGNVDDDSDKEDVGDIITAPSNSSPKAKVAPKKSKVVSRQTTLNFRHRKSRRIAAASKIRRRSKSESDEMPWTRIK